MSELNIVSFLTYLWPSSNKYNRLRDTKAVERLFEETFLKNLNTLDQLPETFKQKTGWDLEIQLDADKYLPENAAALCAREPNQKKIKLLLRKDEGTNDILGHEVVHALQDTIPSLQFPGSDTTSLSNLVPVIKACRTIEKGWIQADGPIPAEQVASLGPMIRETLSKLSRKQKTMVREWFVKERQAYRLSVRYPAILDSIQHATPSAKKQFDAIAHSISQSARSLSKRISQEYRQLIAESRQRSSRIARWLGLA